MADYINPSMYFTRWEFGVGSNRTNRVTYPTEDWTIPAGHEIVNIYYTFSYKASQGINYNFPGINAEKNYSTPSSPSQYASFTVDVPKECWNGEKYGNSSSFRIGFRATSGSGTTSTRKIIQDITLVIEYQASVSPSTVSITRVNIGETQTVEITNESALASHKVKWTYGSVESQEFNLNASQRNVSWAVPSESIPAVAALAPNDSTTIEGSVTVTT